PRDARHFARIGSQCGGDHGKLDRTSWHEGHLDSVTVAEVERKESLVSHELRVWTSERAARGLRKILNSASACGFVARLGAQTRSAPGGVETRARAARLRPAVGRSLIVE